MNFPRSSHSVSNYRRILLIMAGLVLIATIGCDRSGKKSSTTIQPGEIDFPGMQLRPYADNGSFKAIGRIRNKSEKFTIQQIKLKFLTEDVLTTGASTTVAETVVVLRTTVPPRDSKEFQQDVVFGRMPPPRGRHEWSYSIMEVIVQ
jgi:hypothetical protein